MSNSSHKKWSENLNVDVLLWLGLVGFRIVLDLGYQNFLEPLYEYNAPINFMLAIELDRYFLSLAIFAAFVSVIRSRSDNVTNVFMFMSAMFVVAPLTSEYAMNAARPIAPILCSMVALLIIERVSRVRIPDFLSAYSVPRGKSLAIVLASGGVVYLLAWGYFSGATGYLSFDLGRVYDFRDKVGELLDIGPLAYLNLWTYKVFTIFLVCVLLERRRFGWLMLVLACQVLFFGLTSHRIVLFLPLLAIAVWLYLDRVNQLAPIPYVAALGILIALLLFRFLGIDTVAELAIRRAFFVPSGVTFQWFDYFDFHSHVYWADRLLAPVSSGEYVRINIPRLVGEFLVPGSGSAANTGLLGAGYAHAGYVGICFYAIVLGFVLGILNSIVRSGVPLWLVAALSIGPLRTAVADSDLFTSLLSHGLGMVVLLLWLYRERPHPQ